MIQNNGLDKIELDEALFDKACGVFGYYNAGNVEPVPKYAVEYAIKAYLYFSSMKEQLEDKL